MATALTERIDELRQDREHGASWLARRAVEALLEAVEGGADPIPAARELAEARPAMGAIAGALGRVLASGRTADQVVEEARALIAGRDRAAKAIAVLLRPRLGRTVMTHSASATVREALLYARPEHVVCTASKPAGEGRPFAEALRADGLAVDLVGDRGAARAVAAADVLLLGADTVFRDGTLVNKVGTRRLAKAAKEAGVPVLIACETFKLAPFEPGVADEELFELTPPELIDSIVTEEGAYPSDEIRALVDRTPFLREGYALLQT